MLSDIYCSGLQRQREFGCSIFQTGKQWICQKICFTQEIFRDNFEVLKIKGCSRIMVWYNYTLLALIQFLSCGQPNNRIKFLQQALLHLGLWFRVYIGSSISLVWVVVVDWILKYILRPKKNKENAENTGNFALIGAWQRCYYLNFVRYIAISKDRFTSFYQLSQQQRPNFKRGLLLPHHQLQLPPRQQLQLLRLDLFLVLQLQQHIKVLSRQQNQQNRPWFRQRVVREDMWGILPGLLHHQETQLLKSALTIDLVNFDILVITFIP